MIYQYPHTDAEVTANRWEEISADRYWDLLECVPPERMSANAFAVGEPLCSLDDGRVVFTMCVQTAGNRDAAPRYYTKPFPLSSFDPLAFTREIFAQRS